MVGFNRRFAPMTTQLKFFLEPVSEPLALHYRVNAGHLPPDHWVNDREQGGGRILGEVCHFIDLLMFLASSPIVEIEGRPLKSSSRYSGDNVLISIRFANGSEGTISYLANGARSFSKERLEVFGGGTVAVMEDFRRLELVREGSTHTIRHRWRQDKGHRDEWTAFMGSLRQGRGAPISFDDLVCSTLATLRLQESVATGKPLAVDTATFIDAALQTPNSDE
jgi:predicted dehydrogenase